MSADEHAKAFAMVCLTITALLGFGIGFIAGAGRIPDEETEKASRAECIQEHTPEECYYLQTGRVR